MSLLCSSISSKATIVLVDDEPMVLKMLQSFLESLQYQVLPFSSAAEALALINTGNQNIDLVLSDIRMPGMHGIELLTAIRQLSPHLPVILMSGYTDFDMVVAGLRQHAFDILFKPVELDQLEWCIKKALGFLMVQRMEEQYRIRLEDQVAKQTSLLCMQLEELQEARSKANLVEDLKREFLLLMSHEFRTPLNGIIGVCQLLDHTLESQENRELLEMLETSSTNLFRLVDGLLTLSQLLSKSISTTDDRFTATEIIDCLYATFTPKAERNQVTLSLSAAGNDDVLFTGSREAVQLVAGCLLDNAIKFTEPGGNASCVLSLEQPTANDGPAMLRIEVSDTGIGIPADQHQEIFKPFTQLEQFMRRRFGGAGIGLALVQRLCAHLGGQISVDSSPGAGSVFTCILPIRLSVTSITEHSA